MTPLMAEWYSHARAWTKADVERDQFFCVETSDPRIDFARRLVSGGVSVAIGGVSDGRPEKRGVVLVVVTSDACVQELGVSSRDEAAAIISALHHAWPELKRLANELDT